MEDDAKVVQTRDGPKTLGEVRAGVTAAGYSGPMDEASVVGAYDRAGQSSAGPSSAGGPPGLNTGAASAADAAVANWIAWMRLNLVDVRSLDLQEARDVWKRAYDQATLSGYTPGPSYAGTGQKALDAIAALRSNPAYQQAVQANDGETARQMEANTLAQTLGMDPAQARAAIERLRAMTASTGQPSSKELVEQVLGQVPGTPTLERERLQNQTTTDVLRILQGARGPENAFVYAETLANIPPSMRANIQAAMGRLPLTAQNPAQRGMLGDVGVYGQGAGAPVGAYPAGYGPRTGPAPGYSGYADTYPGAPAPNYNPSGIPKTGATAQTYTGAGWQALSTTPVQSAQMQAQAQAQAAAGTPMGTRPNPYGWESANVPQPGANQYATAAYGPRTSPAVAAGMTAPSQLSPTDVNRTDPYAMSLYYAGLEHQGEDINSAKWRYANSLPRAVGPRHASYQAA